MKQVMQLTYKAQFAGITIRRKYALPEENEAFEAKCRELYERNVKYTIEPLEEK